MPTLQRNTYFCRMNSPTLSIIMPVYNAAPYLRQAVDSLLAQTFTDYELIIVEDGSTDISRDIISGFNDSRIQVFYNDGNRGIVFSRNRGMANAKGRYMAPFDADDIAEKFKYEKQLRFLERNPDYGMIGSWAHLIDHEGNLMNEKWKVNAPPRRIPAIQLFRNYFVQSSVVIRREAIPEGGYKKGFDGVEDYQMWIEVALRWKVWNYPEYLVQYRIHDQGISLRESERIQGNDNLIYKTLYKDLNINLTEHQCKLLHIIRKRNTINNIKTLTDIERLLLLILRQNQKLRIYNHRELKKVAWNRWLKSCYFACLPMHQQVWSLLTSPVVRSVI